MARIFTTGFEMQDKNYAEGLTFHAATAFYQEARAGLPGYCIRGVANGWGFNYASPGAVTELYFRFAARLDVTEVRFYKGPTQIGYISLKCGQQPKAYVGYGLVSTGTKVIPDNSQWVVIEVHIKIHSSTGQYQVKLDGELVLDYTGNTTSSGYTDFDQISWFQSGNTAYYTYYDDLAINDTTGGVDDSWCGDGHVYGLRPNGNGDSSDFTGSDADSTDNYLLVDDPGTPDTATYVESETSGHKDLYAVENLPTLPVGATIKRINVVVDGYVASAGNPVNLGIKTGTYEDWKSTSMPTSYRVASQTWTSNPDTGYAWSESEINGLQIGICIP